MWKDNKKVLPADPIHKEGDGIFGERSSSRKGTDNNGGMAKHCEIGWEGSGAEDQADEPIIYCLQGNKPGCHALLLLAEHAETTTPSQSCSSFLAEHYQDHGRGANNVIDGCNDNADAQPESPSLAVNSQFDSA